jgi:hypothetical protein
VTDDAVGVLDTNTLILVDRLDPEDLRRNRSSPR